MNYGSENAPDYNHWRTVFVAIMEIMPIFVA